ncbi:hypothetical protein CEUSTIGMA_g2929.t1 [Chlamydomonas eustigma]|uniref:STI1 domain-containing protein n=1 Tax=Chlamydomonas eustigma TaxID=1157962 RepID=A0A250WXH5_9CHLO|nr:hypothetical protein CEUSTIGMA_g2929.t1 [Chlamydomonas eustigma]|eukprot:GAX75486.1 hypothetical protein CEUSTIGMA_g2929.t1 [Chlamydomonas eustigma]
MYEDDDDDTPPPLSSLPDQIIALEQPCNRTSSSIETTEGEFLPLASTTVTGAKSGPTVKHAPVIKRGFFDSKPSRPKSETTEKSQQRPPEDGLIVLKGRKDGISNVGPSIPDFMRVEPDEQAKRLQEVKGKLTEALKPTPTMINQLSKNPALMAAFEDPEVMAAVDEVAKDPSKMMKYKDNKKVLEFYKSMANFAGGALEKMGNVPL